MIDKESIQTEINFNISLIAVITCRLKRPQTTYEWREAMPEVKNWFGKIRKPAVPAGWCDTYYWPGYRERIDIKELLKTYTWYGFDESTNTVYNKPHVEIKLSHAGIIGQRFETDEEALVWIENIKKESGIEFKTVIV